MKTLPTSLLLSFALAATQQAHADSIVPSNDTYIKIDDSGPYGSAGNILVKQSGGGSGSTVRKGVIEFLVENTEKVTSAKLLLDVSTFDDSAGATSASFYIWGIKDDGVFIPDEEYLTYLNGLFVPFGASLLDNDANGINDSSAKIYDGDPGASGKQPLGVLTITNSDLNKTVSFSSPDLVSYLSSLPSGTTTGPRSVYFLITRQTNSGSLNTGFASKEHGTLYGPRLVVSSREEITPTDDTFVRPAHTATHGSDAMIRVKKVNDDVRVGVIELNVDKARDVREATLSLDVSMYNKAGDSYFWVFGILDGAEDEDISEGSLIYNDLAYYHSTFPPIEFGYLDDTHDSVKNKQVRALGTFLMHPSDLNKTIHFTSSALVDFINDDTNGKITLLITRDHEASGLSTGFASKEHATLHPPTLTLEYAHSDADALPDFELVYNDIDGDANNDLILVVSNSGGGGQIVVDPFVIADLARSLGYDFGSYLEFWDALSVTQQAFLVDVIEQINASSAQDGVITAAELDASLNSLPNGREYKLYAYEGAKEDALVDGGFSLGSPIYTADCAVGNVSVEIGTAQSAVYMGDDGFTVGAQVTVIGVSGTFGSENGTHAGLGVGLSAGIWVEASWGKDDQYGASVPVPFGPLGLQVTLFVKGSDAVFVYEATKDALEAGWSATSAWFEGGWVSAVDWSEATWVVFRNQAEDAYLISKLFVSATGTSAALWVGEAGRSAAVWYMGATHEIAADLRYGGGIGMAAIKSAPDNAADIVSDWAVSGATTLSSAYHSAEGWVAGAAEDVEDLGEDIEEGFSCVVSPSCLGL